jgi:HEAT repeat protein
MPEQQLDLFSDTGARDARPIPQSRGPSPVAADLDDRALVVAIAESSLTDSAILAAEAGRRRLGPAVPALAALCRRFAGFGAHRAVPEQVAAMEGLAEIGGRDAADAVTQIIERGVVQGPTLSVAVNIAARLHSILSANVLLSLLQHPDSHIRANACRCARPLSEVISHLTNLLNDVDQTVARSAACALGQMGRIEARLTIKGLLRNAPSQDAIDAAASIADEECVVLLGRIARAGVGLSGAALAALENIDDPRASVIAAAVRNSQQPRDSATQPAK